MFTAADVPGELRVGIIHTDWPVFIPEGGRTSYLGDVLAIVVADSRETAREAAKLVEVTYRPLRPLTDAVAAIDDPEDAVWELDGQRALPLGLPPRRRRRGARGLGPHRARGLPDPTRRARLPRARVDPRRAASRTAP